MKTPTSARTSFGWRHVRSAMRSITAARPYQSGFRKGTRCATIADMARTSFAGMSCSVARTLDVLGERWTPLILRDVLLGVRRFDAIQRNLGISRKVLAERL